MMPLPDGVCALLARIGCEPRRKEARKKVGSLLASYRQIDIANQSLDMDSKNAEVVELGMKGMKVVVGPEIKTGDWLELSLNLPMHVVPLMLTVEVIHLHHLPGQSKRGIAGIKVLESSSSVSEKIGAFLTQASRNKG